MSLQCNFPDRSFVAGGGCFGGCRACGSFFRELKAFLSTGHGRGGVVVVHGRVVAAIVVVMMIVFFLKEGSIVIVVITVVVTIRTLQRIANAKEQFLWNVQRASSTWFQWLDVLVGYVHDGMDLNHSTSFVSLLAFCGFVLDSD